MWLLQTMVTTIDFKHWYLLCDMCNKTTFFAFGSSLTDFQLYCRQFFKWTMCKGWLIMISVFHLCHLPLSIMCLILFTFLRLDLLTCVWNWVSVLFRRWTWVLISCYCILVSNILDLSVKDEKILSVFNFWASSLSHKFAL